MRSISLLALISIALAGYAKGDVTITAQDVGGGKLLIGYQTTGGVVPVAFGLDLQLSNGATFSNVTSTTGAFSFYPARFRDYIDPANPNWEDPHYLPMSSWGDPDALGGLGTSGLTIEMASMLDPYIPASPDADFDGDGIIDIYDSSILSGNWLIQDDPFCDLYIDGSVNFRDYAIFLNGHFDPIPTFSGDLLLLQLNGNGAEITTANISLNLARGGIVLEDASYAATSLPTQVTIIVPEPATLLLLTLGGLVLRRRK